MSHTNSGMRCWQVEVFALSPPPVAGTEVLPGAGVPVGNGMAFEVEFPVM